MDIEIIKKLNVGGLPPLPVASQQTCSTGSQSQPCWGPCPAQQFALISHEQIGLSANLLGRALPANTSTATT